ncbi:MAG: hypothetical protein OSB43_12425 [Nocardioides sp.]|nr:hypothetical protein [Nocardioides sp.]MDE0777073.1 hypothetical protein [Nocardioides sp.]
MPRMVRVATSSQAATSATYSATAATTRNGAPVAAASPDVPVTSVPTGNVNDHQVRVNGNPAGVVRAARTVSARASEAHNRAKPHMGAPKRTSRVATASPYGAGRDAGAVTARVCEAVIDCPSGPSTIHRVGTAAAAPTWWCINRPQISVMIIRLATRVRPNIIRQARCSVSRRSPAGRWAISSGPVAALTIGGTTGINHPPKAASTPTRWVVKAR